MPAIAPPDARAPGPAPDPAPAPGASPDPDALPGVKPAEQARSRALRDRFVDAGRAQLLHRRADDLSVPELARAAGSSVGGFYSRFETKEAFFAFLRARMQAEHDAAFARALAPERLAGAPLPEAAAAFVDCMIGLYTGPWRGVLREACARLQDRPEDWSPLRARGAALGDRLAAALAETRDETRDEAGAETRDDARDDAREDTRPGLLADRPDAARRVGFAVQMVFSVLNNEMMTPGLRFDAKDPAFAPFLAEMFAGFLAAPR
ncbi:TetR/AcrR family transcriptional regulator [Rhodovulum sp. DZ06]|uniref:TetR/AcrR family transcriptional regulator n=1 Tax=Rhodovulum sp. DZ06 TaxID=3425126 RepID=UPI003D34B260